MSSALVASIIYNVFYFYQILIVVWCLLTWIPSTSGGVFEDIKIVLGRLVLPYLNLFRRLIPPMGGLDWSPVVAILVLSLIQQGIGRIL